MKIKITSEQEISHEEAKEITKSFLQYEFGLNSDSFIEKENKVKVEYDGHGNFLRETAKPAKKEEIAADILIKYLK